MIGSYIFNGVNSESFELICKSIKRPLLPARKNKDLEVDGISGAYDFGDDDYELRKIIMQCVYKGDSFNELRSRARSIAAWLSTTTFVPLIINDEPDKYYLAKVNDELDLDSFLESGTVDVEFDCQPFAFSVVESSFTYSNITGLRNDIIIHNGTRKVDYRSQKGSKFNITVNGSWTTISFTLNGQSLTFNESGSSTTLVIDNIEMTAFKNGISKFDELDGDVDSFLKILPGNNNFKIDGTGLNCSVTVDFIELWI